MDPAPYTWRARKGYITAPTPSPEPEPEPEVQQPAPIIIPMASYNYQYYLIPQHQPLAYAAPIFQAPAPAPAPAPASSRKSSSSNKKIDGPAKMPPPPPPSEPAAPKNPNEPPQLRPGMNYMFAPEHTKLHIFNKSSKVWEDKHAGKSFDFKIFKVATTFTPTMVIENVIKGKEPKGWAVTEVVEKGDGAWAKGTTIEHGGERAGASLSSMGWTGKCGDSLPPVWLVIHKV